MLKLRYLYIGVIVFALMASCNSSKKLLEQGAYYQSVMAAVDKLQKSPNNKKSQRALLKAYPLAVQDFLNEIKKAKSNAVHMPWTNIADSYQSLNNMYEAIKASPKARQIIRNPQEYYKQYAEVKGKAAAEQYTAGDRALKKGTREDAKEAYFYFLNANDFQSGYKDVDRKLQEAKEVATLRVVVEAVPVPSRYFKVSADFFYDQVDKHLRNIMGRNQFVAFYSEKDARRLKLTKPDQVLKLQFEDFAVGQSKAFQKEETVTRDSVNVGEVKMEDGSKKPVLGTVSAKLIVRRLEILSGGILSMTINDGYNNTRIFRDEMPGEFLWVAEWATYKGDERALTDEQLAMSKRVEMTPPVPQDLFVEFTKPIYSQLTEKLNRYYQNI
ncbi:hypothetical protein [Catalinimonas niigatensis]|uniref:hypothetical protein n=1 Tax=Catalinimonas niigatensis TaxID=1397264 RepID=UPI00266564E6|nr:hypothetical protein [Catalinimonas niigatensis]WPP53054.1 hypothetical protein PZB72_11770 [Catalinimonas niigatensis]